MPLVNRKTGSLTLGCVLYHGKPGNSKCKDDNAFLMFNLGGRGIEWGGESELRGKVCPGERSLTYLGKTQSCDGFNSLLPLFTLNAPCPLISLFTYLDTEQ
ncbi:integrin alpha-3 [Platysternon megacephalum]|uniref:Integrin alpha-3 n=1 Tax=Platysternon megacephalum TaxID=55544 RepID=A0A4D9ESS8_9SAUR|nr:integrin alpha-3 [Platysternon megacephalum]